MPLSRPVRVLLVEDHPADIDLTRKAFSALKTANTLHVVLDGVEAMQFLKQEGRFTSAERPDLVLLDLNMPRKDGREVLREMQADPNLCAIPVVILTTSSAQNDVDGAYRLGANGYIVKPVAFNEFTAIIRILEAYWFNVSILPGT